MLSLQECSCQLSFYRILCIFSSIPTQSPRKNHVVIPCLWGACLVRTDPYIHCKVWCWHLLLANRDNLQSFAYSPTFKWPIHPPDLKEIHQSIWTRRGLLCKWYMVYILSLSQGWLSKYTETSQLYWIQVSITGKYLHRDTGQTFGIKWNNWRWTIACSSLFQG